MIAELHACVRQQAVKLAGYMVHIQHTCRYMYMYMYILACSCIRRFSSTIQYTLDAYEKLYYSCMQLPAGISINRIAMACHIGRISGHMVL